MQIRPGTVPRDSTRYSEPSAKEKRVKAKNRQEEEAWSERSDYDEIEDFYTPSEQYEHE